MDAVLCWLALACVVLVACCICFLVEIARPLTALFNRLLAPLLRLPTIAPGRLYWRAGLYALLLPAATAAVLSVAARTGIGWPLVLSALSWQLELLLPAWLLVRALGVKDRPPRWPAAIPNALLLAAFLLVFRSNAPAVLFTSLGEEARLAGLWVLPGAALALAWGWRRQAGWANRFRCAGLGAVLVVALLTLWDLPVLLARLTPPGPPPQREQSRFRSFAEEVRLDPGRALRQARIKADGYHRRGRRDESRRTLDEAIAVLEKRQAAADLPWAWSTQLVQLRMDRAWRLREVEHDYRGAMIEYRRALDEDTLKRVDLWGEYALAAALAGDATAVAEAMPHWQEGRDFVNRDPGYWYDAAPILLSLRGGWNDAADAMLRAFARDHDANASLALDDYLERHEIRVFPHVYAVFGLHAVANASELGDDFDAVVKLWRRFRQACGEDVNFEASASRIGPVTAPWPVQVLVRNAFVSAMSESSLPPALEALRGPLPGWAGAWSITRNPVDASGTPVAFDPASVIYDASGNTRRITELLSWRPVHDRGREGILRLNTEHGEERAQGDFVLLASHFTGAATPTTLYVWHERTLGVYLDEAMFLSRRNLEDFYRNVAEIHLPAASGERTLLLRTDSPRVLVYTDPPVQWRAEAAP